jgi:hypothetical protein
MPFFEYHEPEEIKPVGAPVDVSVAFSIYGAVKPMLFQVEDEHGVRTKNHIEGIKFSKAIKGGTSFRVFYMAGKQRRECSLNFYPELSLWYLEV